MAVNIQPESRNKDEARKGIILSAIVGGINARRGSDDLCEEGSEERWSNQNKGININIFK